MNYKEITSVSKLKKSEIVSVIGAIAQDLMANKIGRAYAGERLEALKFVIMSQSEKKTDFSKIASALGKIKSSKKSEASRQNGKKGGRPKKAITPQQT